MKRHLIITNESGESVDLYTDPGIRLVSIDDIGFECGVNSTNAHGYDGELYQSSQVAVKMPSVIVRYIGPTWKHEQHKKRLTNLVASKQLIKLRYVTENIDVYIEGRAQRVTTPPNVRPMNTQIVIKCTDPYWKVSGDNTAVIAGTKPCFKFPIRIPSTGMIFGSIKSALITEINNEGTADSGAIFTITAISKCTNPKLENIDTGEFIQVTASMEAGDKLIINTNWDSKSIKFIHDNVTTNYFNFRVSGSTYLQVRQGINRFKYTVDEGDEHAVEITCKYDTKYGGI